MPGRVLITGCSSGIGRAAALGFTAAGYEVIATARRAATLDDLQVAQRLVVDVSSPESIEAAIAQAGEIDVLINNAGWTIWGPVEEVKVEDAKRLFDVNVWGTVRMFQAVAPQMRSRGRGLVINVSSLAATSTRSFLGFYSASKAAVARFTEAMHNELLPYGARACAIELAGVLSNFPDNRLVVEARDSGYAQAFAEMRERIALTRTTSATAEQVAQWLIDIARETEPAVRYVVSMDQQISRVE